MQTVIDDGKLKELFKQAIIEAMEDVAMMHAIQEREDSGIVSRKDVFKALERKA